jgi:hypothetical protein
MTLPPGFQLEQPEQTPGSNLPPGFVLEADLSRNLPPGFVLEEQAAPKQGFAQIGSELMEGWRNMKTAGHGTEFNRSMQQAMELENQARVAKYSDDPTAKDTADTMLQLARQDAARSAAQIKGIQQDSMANYTARPVITKINKAESLGEAWNAFLTDPMGAVVGATATSAVQMAPMIAAAALGGPVLGIVGMGLTSMGQEFGQEFASFAAEHNIPPEKYVEFYSNPENLKAATNRAYKRGIAIGLFDAASGGIAGKTIAPFAKTAAGKVIANMATQLPIQAAMGAAGEGAAQLATDGKLMAGPMFLEALGELGTGPVEVLSLNSQIKEAKAVEQTAGGLEAADAILAEADARKEEAKMLRASRAQARAAAEGRNIIGQQFGGRAAVVDDTPAEWGDKIGRTRLTLEGDPLPEEIPQPTEEFLRVRAKEKGKQGRLIQYQEEFKTGGEAFRQSPDIPNQNSNVIPPEGMEDYPSLWDYDPTANADVDVKKDVFQIDVGKDEDLDAAWVPAGSNLTYIDADGKPRLGKVVQRNKSMDDKTKPYKYWIQGYKRPGETELPVPMLLDESDIDSLMVNVGSSDPAFDTRTPLYDVGAVLKYIDQLLKQRIITAEQSLGLYEGLLHFPRWQSNDKGGWISIPGEMIDPATKQVNIQNTLAWIVGDPKVREKRPDLVQLALHLLPKVNESLAARVVPDSTQDGPATAHYRSVEHQMEFNLSSNSAFTVGTFLHELVHALTVRELSRYLAVYPGFVRYNASWTKETVPPAIKEIVEIYSDYVRGQKEGFVADSKYKLTPGGVPVYGTTDVFEFVSEILTNREFQNIFARETRYKDRPKKGFTKLVTRLWEAVAKVLGFESPEAGEWLQHTMNTATEVIELQTKAEKENPVQLMTDLKRLWPLVNWADRYNQVGTGVWSMAIDVSKANNQIAASGADPFTKTPIGQVLELIPPDPDPDNPSDIREIAKDVDGASWVNGYPGALQAAEIRQSKLIKAVYRLMDNAKKRAARWDREYVKPLEHEWVKILRNPEQTKLMHGVFMRELKARRKFTPEELARILPPKLLQPYNDFRATLDEAMTLQNQALVDMGLKEVTPMEAYAASRWNGPWRSIIRDEKGKVVWAVAESTKPAAEKAVRWILAQNPALVAEKVNYKSSRTNDSTLEAGYREMLALLDQEDPNTQIIQNAWIQAITGETENVLGQEKHFERKYGARGFAGDRPWANSHQDRRAMFEEQFKYLKGASQWAHMQVPVTKAKKLVNHPDLQHLPNNIQYAKEYVRNHLGFGTTETMNRLENSLAEFFGQSKYFPGGTGETALGMVKSLFYLTALGWSIPYTFYALLQPLLSAGRHARLTSEGHTHNIGKTFAGAVYDGALFFLYHAIKRGVVDKITDPDLAKLDNIRNAMTETGQRALEYLDVNGVIDINPLSDINDLKIPQSLHTARQYAGYLMLAAEQVSRAMAFMSFAHHYNQSPQPNIGWGDVMMWAEDATKDTMVDYRPTERAMVFQKLGLSGNALSTLNTFKLNWMAQVWKYGKMGFKQGNWRPFIMQMGMYLTLSGALGVISMDDADDLWENFKELLPDEQWNEVKDFSPKMWAMKNMNDWMAWGPIGVLSGTNVPTRGSLGDVIPVFPFESTLGESVSSLFPFAGYAGDMAKGTVALGKQLVGKGSPDENKADIYRGLPTALKGPFDVAFLQDQNLAVSTADPSLGVYERTTGETIARLLGVRSIKEAEFMEGRRRKDDIDTKLENRQKKASQRFVEFALKGDNRAGEELEKFVLLGGDPKNLVSSARLTRAAIRRYTDYATQQMIKAKPGHRAGWENLIRYFEYYSAE